MATNECRCGHAPRDHDRLDEEDRFRGCLVVGCRCPGFVPKDQGVLAVDRFLFEVWRGARPRPGFALLRADIDQRAEIGWKTYGRPLETFNGRNPAQDAYEEALDLAVYLRQLLEERAVMLDLLRDALRVLPRGQAAQRITATLGEDPEAWR